MNQKQNPKFDENEQTLKDKRKIKPSVLFLFLLGFAFLLLICWLFWILSGEALGFVIFALLTNISYFFGGYYFLYYDNYGRSSQRRKKINQNDKQYDEIIFEVKKPSFLEYAFDVDTMLEIVFPCFFLFYVLPPLLDNKNKGFVWFIAFIVLIWMITKCVKNIFKKINYKKFYITKNNLIVQFYLTKDIVLPLGSFFVYRWERLNVAADLIPNELVIQTFEGKSYEILDMFFKFEGKSYEILDMFFENDFYEKVNEIIKPYVIPYLLNLSEKEYLKITKKLFLVNGNIDTTFFKEVDKLREEQRNGK